MVATTVGGLPYLLRDGETGLLVPAEDAAAMADAIRRLIDRPELAAALSANGRRLAESCGWATVRDQWAVLFDEVYQDVYKRQVTDGVEGFLVPPRAPAATADALARLAASPDLRRTMGAAGRARVQRDFALSDQIDAFVDLFVGVAR